MSKKIGIGYSPLSDRIYLGTQNKEKGMWIGEKQDITSDFIAVSAAYFEENSIREISNNAGGRNLFINIKNDKASIEGVIKNLTKRLAKLS